MLSNSSYNLVNPHPMLSLSSYDPHSYVVLPQEKLFYLLLYEIKNAGLHLWSLGRLPGN